MSETDLQSAVYAAFGGLSPSMREPTDAAPSFQPELEAIAETYPTLGKHLSSFEIGWGTAPENDPRGLEFYPPWETDNPRPGVPYIELYNKALQGQSLQDAIAGDALHYLAAVHPEIGEAVDPAWREMRGRFAQSITSEQKKVDRRAYKEEGDTRSYDDWFEGSRLDAYLRGYLFPDQADEWRSTYNGDQVKQLERMRQYLRGVERADPE